MKRTISLLLALCLTLCAAVALGDANTDYKLTDEPVTYTYFFTNNYITDLNEVDPFFQNLEAMTNVHIDWIIVSSNDANTRTSLMYASGDMPDFIGNPNGNDFLKYAPLGVYFPINTLMETCMPNFMAATSGENQEVRDALTLPDGNIYSLPSFGMEQLPSATCVLINKDWMEALTLETPTTTAELTEVLKAFKEGDPNGNGLADEIPFGFNYASQWTLGEINAWFGVTKDIMIRDDVVTYSPYEEGWKSMVTWLNELWNADLLDAELFTQDNASFNAKVRQETNVYGVIMCYHKYNILSEADLEKYEVLGPLDGGTEVWGSLRSRSGKYEVSLAKAALRAGIENPELALAWADIFYDPYYGSQIPDGAVGHLTYLREEDGMLAQNTENVPTQYASFAEWCDNEHYNQFPCFISNQYYGYLENANLARMARREIGAQYGEAYVNDVLPSNFMLLEESEAMNAYTTDITKYVNEMYALWVTGERDVEADWAEYQAHLEQLGVKEYVALYQAYYDRVTGKN